MTIQQFAYTMTKLIEVAEQQQLPRGAINQVLIELANNQQVDDSLSVDSLQNQLEMIKLQQPAERIEGIRLVINAMAKESVKIDTVLQQIQLIIETM